MELFSEFCNVCCKADDGSLRDISAENMKHVLDILISFVGHADVMEHGVIYLCQLCCDELTRIDKFKETCFNNLVQLRQNYFKMKSKLEFEENSDAVKNTLKTFVQNEVLRRNSLAETNRPISISTQCHEIVNSSADFSKNDSELNRVIINLKSKRKECEFDGNCNDISVINNVAECHESRVPFTKAENIKKTMLKCSKNTKMTFEREFYKNLDVPDINKRNDSNTPRIEFIKEECDLNNEIDRNDLNVFTMQNFENESGDVEMLVINNGERSVHSEIVTTKKQLHVKQENDVSEGLKLEKTAFEFVNVCTNELKQECGEDAKVAIKSASTSCNSKSIAESLNMEHPYVSEHWIIGNTTRPSAANELVDSSEAWYTCAFCRKTFTDVYTLEAHESKHSHASRPCKCTECNKAFSHPYKLLAHQRTHTGDRPYQCTVCTKAFTQLSNLKTHELTHINDRPYKCTFCNKAFKKLTILNRHEREHTGDTLYKCTICNKAFVHLSKLLAHERSHSGERPFECTVCTKTFAQSSNLKAHELTHRNDRPYECSVCNKAFKNATVLNRHERVHTDVRPYKCTVCDKSFKSSGDLNVHERIHNGKRPYKCNVCDKAFKQRSSLNAHERVHSGHGS